LKEEPNFYEQANILLVDDRHQNLVALREILSPLGENLVEARSGAEALKCLLKQDFAVVLLDVMMPGMDGFETAALMRQRDKSRFVPIIFITAMLTDEAHAFQGYAAGAVDYIVKPFPPEILRSKVSIFVELYRKADKIRRQSELIRIIKQREYEASLAEARQRAEQEAERVRLEQKIAQAVIEHAPIGIVRLDHNLSILDANPTFCRQFDVLCRRGKAVTDELSWLPDQLIEAMTKGEPYQISQFRIVRCPETKDKYWDLTVWPIKDLSGCVIATILAAKDVTETVQLDEQRKDFVGTLAHDLQTPVIASDRALELLLQRLKGKLEPELQRLVSMLKQNNENLLHMIQSLLDVYQYETGAKSLYFDEVDLKPLVTTCVEELAALAQAQGVSIKCEFSNDDRKVSADRTGLRRVITNLLDNAIKYSYKGGIVTVSVSKSEDEMVLEVKDCGVGIKKDDLAYLFERFWHGSGQKSFKASSGLGLYLCRQIIAAHAGRIECESEPDRYTKFIVHLPSFKPELFPTHVGQLPHGPEADTLDLPLKEEVGA